MKSALIGRYLVVAAALAFNLAAHSQSQQDSPAEPQIPIIRIENVPLSDAIGMLARRAEINFTVDPKIISASSGDAKVRPPITVRWEGLTAKEALARLLKEHSLFSVENPQTGVAKITMTNSPPRVFAKELFSGSKEILPRIILDDVPLEMAFAQLGEKANLKLELDTNLTDSSRPFKERTSVSVRFKDLTAGQALAAICDQHNLQITKLEQVGVWHVSRGK